MNNPEELDRRPSMLLWGRRVSLLRVLIGIAVIALVLSHVQASRDRSRLREELRALRSETGQLYIDDPSRFYLNALPGGDVHGWQWRVHVPEGVSLAVKCHAGTLSRATGPPPGDTLLRLSPGEHVFSVSIQPHSDGGWHWWAVRHPQPPGSWYSLDSGVPIPADLVDMLESPHDFRGVMSHAVGNPECPAEQLSVPGTSRTLVQMNHRRSRGVRAAGDIEGLRLWLEVLDEY